MIALFFDTETTGIKQKWSDFVPALVQLGAILQDTETKRVLAEMNLIVDQDGKPIPAGAAAIHGITDELAAKYGFDIRGVDLMFAKMVKLADAIIAHNIDYDLDVVKDNLPASQLAIAGKPTFCTMDNNVMIVKAPLTEKQKNYFTSKGEKPDKPYKSPNLTETYKHYFGKTFDGAHDAMADIRACRDVFFAMNIT